MLLLQTCPDTQAFKEELQQYFTDIQAEQAWVETNGADAMSAVLELVRRHKVCILAILYVSNHHHAIACPVLLLHGALLEQRHCCLDKTGYTPQIVGHRRCVIGTVCHRGGCTSVVVLSERSAACNPR